MAVASLDIFQAGIAIKDVPISYAPAVGYPMPLEISYHQRFTKTNAPLNHSNMGVQWQFNWLSYIEGGPANGSEDAVHHAPDGNKFDYSGYSQAVVQTVGQPIIEQGDFQDNQAWTHATLHYRQGPERYELWDPDGSKQIFSQAVGASGNRLFFLTSIQDPQGNITTVNYDPAAAASGNAVITSVTDPKGGQLVFSYNSGDPLKITKITRSCDGLSAKFTYSSSGQLLSSTDTMGMTSSFTYLGTTNFVSSMVTPYGTTTFHSQDGSGFSEADLTNPLGLSERAEYRDTLDSSMTPASESQVPSATGLAIDNTNLNARNSYYWNRRAMADAVAAGVSVDSAAFYSMARITHWASGPLGSVPVPLSYKAPLEGRIWYNYPGQPDPDSIDVTAGGSSTQPSVVARLLDGGVTQASFASYNAAGMATQAIDPVGRTTNFTYDTNGIDLLQVTQTNGAVQDVLSTRTYNATHLPLTITDASGRVTAMTYNALGQLQTTTNAKGETTTLAYDANNRLQTVTGPVTGAVTSFTWDNVGRVHTVTDSEGYDLTKGYDHLDRLTSVVYPDGTSEQIIYDKLDVAKTVDRQGRATWRQYDAIRELKQVTDPASRVTKFAYCTCGALSSLTDANGNVTTWNLDAEGRKTAKIYADGSQIVYAYEANSGRLHSVTDARGNVAVYSYNADDTLASTTYTPATGVAATPSVSYTYDTVYSRVTSMTDGTGTTTYSYNSVPANAAASPTTGVGLLASVSSPIAGSSATVAYGYDELGRGTSRTIDGGSEVDAGFDSLGRVINVSNPLGAFTYAYVNQTSRLSSVTYPSSTGLSTAYAYLDNVGDQRLQEIKNLKGSSVLSQFDYTYNPVGTIATWKQQVDSNTPTQYALSYDAADQLTGAVQSNTSTSAVVTSNKYNYDPVGNRLAETTLSATTSGMFNKLNQLTNYGMVSGTQTVAGTTSASVPAVMVNGQAASVTGGTNFTVNVPLPSGTNTVSVVAQPGNGSPTTQRFQLTTSGTPPTALTYDADGNTLTDENGNSYQWDVLNRLTKITYPSGASSLFAYDGLSRRIQIVEKNSSGTVTSTKNYLWTSQQMAEERDASNAVTKRFFAQGEQQSGIANYYTFDRIGSIREMVDSHGGIITILTYDPYGKVNIVSGGNFPTFQYAHYYSHTPSGFNFTLLRVYDENAGRWISRDPIGEKGGANIYNYVNNDPSITLDSTGLIGVIISLGGGAQGGLFEIPKLSAGGSGEVGLGVSVTGTFPYLDVALVGQKSKVTNYTGAGAGIFANIQAIPGSLIDQETPAGCPGATTVDLDIGEPIGLVGGVHASADGSGSFDIGLGGQSYGGLGLSEDSANVYSLNRGLSQLARSVLRLADSGGPIGRIN